MLITASIEKETLIPTKNFIFYLVVIIPIITMTTADCRHATPLHLSSGRPNILLISLDTLRYDTTSLYEKSNNSTPFLKKIKEIGINFINTYSTYDATGESHFSLLTGYIRGLRTEIDRPEASIAYQLRQQGYNTFGTAANPNLSARSLRYLRGFENYNCLGDLWGNMETKQRDQYLPNIDLRISSYSGVLNDWNRLFVFSAADQILPLLKQAIKSIEKPFFGFVNFNDAHDPYYPSPEVYSLDFEKSKGYTSVPDLRFRKLLPEQEHPEKIEDQSYRELMIQKIDQAGSRPWSTTFDLEPAIIEIYKCRYEAEVRELDLAIANIFDFLRTQELLESTIVIITADHGESFGELNLITHAFNLKGDRESTFHVPLLIIFPHAYRLKRNEVHIPCTIADIPPTIYDIVGINWLPLVKTTLPGNFGKSLLPYINKSISPLYKNSISTSDWKQLNQNQKNKEDNEALKRLRSLGYVK
jgi:arylsulfatase A-like enzyme